LAPTSGRPAAAWVARRSCCKRRWPTLARRGERPDARRE
jgi:hypothetical protein